MLEPLALRIDEEDAAVRYLLDIYGAVFLLFLRETLQFLTYVK